MQWLIKITLKNHIENMLLNMFFYTANSDLYKRMKIKDLCSYAPKSRIKAGEAVENAEYLFFTSSADENKRYTDFQFDKEAIIMGTGGNATLHYYNGKFSVSTDCLVLLPNSKIKCKYLYYFFKSRMSVLEAGFKGAGLKHTNKKYIEEINVSEVPNLTTQEKIISHLDTISENIEKLNRKLELFDSLTKARFVEMFGDPEENPFNWEKILLAKAIINANNGMARRGNDKDGNIVMRLVELQDGYIDYSNPNRIILKDNEKKRYLLKDNDFLFARVNGNPDNVGRCAVFHDIGEDVYHNDHIIRVHFDEELLNGTFASALFNSDYGKKQLKSQIKTSAGQYTVSQDGIGPIVTILPPAKLQNQFADFVQQVDKSKLAVQQSLEKTQQLFDSLMQEYFG